MKKIVCMILVSGLLFVSGVLASTVYREVFGKEVDFSLRINGELQEMSVPLVSVDDYTYIKVREAGNLFGYDVYWNNKERTIEMTNMQKETLPYFGDINEPKSGELSNGVKFTYTGQNEKPFSVDEFLKPMTSVNSPYGVIATAKTAAKIANELIGIADTNKLIVNFDKEKDVWVVTVSSGASSHSGARTVVLQRSDGKIVGFYEIR